MKKITLAALSACFLLAVGMPAMADPIIAVSGAADTFYLVDPTQALAVGWSQGAGAGNVGIVISFLDFTLEEGAIYSAYLTNQIGAGTTAANELAATTFTAGPDISSVPLFNHVALNAGSYYLTVGFDPALNENLYPEGAWGGTSDPLPVFTRPGVTDLGQFYSQAIDSAYIPASAFAADTSAGARLLYTVSPVPEPGTWFLLLVSALGLSLLAFKRG